MSVAFLFPGQGSQSVGMGKLLFEAFPESRRAFETADAALDFPLSDLCFDGPEQDLQLTANTQPAILTASIAAFLPLRARGVRPQWVAGHSLGEYSALVAAGSLELAETVRLVRRRGEYMQEAVPVGEGAMAAIIAVELADVEEACRQAAEGDVVVPANINGPGQVVIAGHTGAVDRAIKLCQAAGARMAVRLPVSAPFHSPLMRPAQERLAVDLEQIAFAAPECPLVTNVDAQPARAAEECRQALVRQVSSRVRWRECVELLIREGVTTMVEVGPGKVLSGLVRKIDKTIQMLNVEDPASLERAVSALAVPAS